MFFIFIGYHLEIFWKGWVDNYLCWHWKKIEGTSTHIVNVPFGAILYANRENLGFETHVYCIKLYISYLELTTIRRNIFLYPRNTTNYLRKLHILSIGKSTFSPFGKKNWTVWGILKAYFSEVKELEAASALLCLPFSVRNSRPSL